jgi:hypothetical protein
MRVIRAVPPNPRGKPSLPQTQITVPGSSEMSCMKTVKGAISGEFSLVFSSAKHVQTTFYGCLAHICGGSVRGK